MTNFRVPMIPARLHIPFLTMCFLLTIVSSTSICAQNQAPGPESPGDNKKHSGQQRLQIVLTQPWTDTGMEIVKGQIITVTASGDMNWFTPQPGWPGCPVPGKCVSKPDGTSCPYSGFLAQGLACWSLIGKIGDGTAFKVGSLLKDFPAPASGELFLGVNDNNYADNSGKWEAEITTGCGDVRDLMAREYVTSRVSLTPECTDFVDSGHSAYFSFNQFNVACPSQKSAKYPWALLRNPLLVGIDPWVDKYRAIITNDYKRPYENRIINSSYRVPSQNKACKGAQNSRHMYGDAADLRNISRTKIEWDAMHQAAQGNASWVEGPSGPCRLGCVHADWRDK
jgi:hypothetical protein